MYAALIVLALVCLVVLGFAVWLVVQLNAHLFTTRLQLHEANTSAATRDDTQLARLVLDAVRDSQVQALGAVADAIAKATTAATAAFAIPHETGSGDAWPPPAGPVAWYANSPEDLSDPTDDYLPNVGVHEAGALWTNDEPFGVNGLKVDMDATRSM